MSIKTAKELAAACEDVAKNYKTLYVYGCFGAPMNEKNKARYCNANNESRTAAIQAASADTFGFDCVNLIKGLLWGWEGDASKTYGGAVYKSNGVPDTNANGLFQLCQDVSTDFSTILVGEAVWLSGHIGVYIGNGLAVECTPKWDSCVQITAVGNIGTKSGYHSRKWTKHGKIPYVTYEAEQPVEEPTDVIGVGSVVAFKSTAKNYYPGGSKISETAARPYQHIVTQTTSKGKQVVKGGAVCVLLGKKKKPGSDTIQSGINTWVAVYNLEIL